jgi:hypothetical protein
MYTYMLACVGDRVHVHTRAYTHTHTHTHTHTQRTQKEKYYETGSIKLEHRYYTFIVNDSNRKVYIQTHIQNRCVYICIL